MPTPSRLTPSTIHLIADLIANGASLRQAAQLLDIPTSTAEGWQWYGRAARGRHWPYDEFAQSIQAARLEHQARLREIIEQRQS